MEPSVDKTILIVGDDAKLRKLLDEYLASYGFEVLMKRGRS